MKKNLLLATLAVSLIGSYSLFAEDKQENPRVATLIEEVEKVSEDEKVKLSLQEEEENTTKAISCDKHDKAASEDETQESLV